MTHTEALQLAAALNGIANGLQYDPSGQWGAETVGPINAAAEFIRTALTAPSVPSGEPFTPAQN